MFKRVITFHADEFPFIADEVDEIVSLEVEENTYRKIKVEVTFYEEDDNK